MCEQSGVKEVLRGIPFKVAALADIQERGSYKRSLADSVYQAIRADIDFAMKRLEAGLNDCELPKSK